MSNKIIRLIYCFCGTGFQYLSFKHFRTVRNVKSAFSIIELLVVISIISLIMGILMPTLIASRAESKKLVCRSNLRQLLFANISYADENDGYYVHAALDIFAANKHRWYGEREDINKPFDTTKGPLSPFLGQSFIKCPTKVNFMNVNPAESDYDQGCGGYGYNMTYLGSSIWKDGYEDQSCKTTTKETTVLKPAQTLMFADAAMSKAGCYIEYSFAEPRYFVVNGKAVDNSGWNPSPSIHFKHRDQANSGWVDGHISSKKAGRYDGVNSDGSSPSKMHLGWFEPMDNSLFDLQ